MLEELIPDLIAALRIDRRAIVRAPPGAGKTTVIPGALLDAGLAGDKDVVVLEPRRIAARAAAEYVARRRGEALGAGVGYRVRMEQKGGRSTRLWFVTEGVLGRQLTRDPFLERIGIVILDEFHERHLQGDVALAAVRELQESVRPDLLLVVMSATLETEHLAEYLIGAPVLTSTGRSYPVGVEFAAAEESAPLPMRTADALRRLLGATAEGDVLIFLPGAGEIRRTAAAIAPLATQHDLDVCLLHGDLPLDEQQRVLRPGPRRKVVLSTNVAETSLTIEGVTAVIDSGVARLARFDPRRGMNALRVVPISQASAEQRAGRAGRTAPGRCIRLWTEADHRARRRHETPEIARLDLSGTVLELHAWGLRDIRGFGWLDAPPESSLRRAERLLADLGAGEAESGAVSAIGRRMLDLAVEPRLARILVEAERRGCPETGALLAALASERDISTERRAFGSSAGARWQSGPSDLLLRCKLFEEAARDGFRAGTCGDLGLDPGAVRAVDRVRRQLARALGGRDATADDSELEELLLRCTLAGFPDRVVRRGEAGSRRGTMVGGIGVTLAPESVVRDAELFVAVDVDARTGPGRTESEVQLASAIRREWLDELRPGVERARELVFDEKRERVVERTQERFCDLVLAQSERLDVDPHLAGEILAEAARRDLTRAVRVDDKVAGFLERLRFLGRNLPESGLPAEPGQLLERAVVSLCAGQRSFADLRRADLGRALRHLLTGAQRAAVEREAPTEFALPNGRRVAIRYERDKPPTVSARLQELFGLRRTPRLARQRVPLLFEVLGPNYRPVQLTDDLESFWRRTYPEIRKEMRGRYPKHRWPEDPNE